MTEMNVNGNGNGNTKWQLTKEKILMFSGLILCLAEFISAEIFSRPFHFEFLILGAALCGVSIASWGDKR